MVSVVQVLDPTADETTTSSPGAVLAGHGTIPVLSGAAIAQLRDELEDDDALDGFLRCYLDMLPDRVADITAAFAQRDHPHAWDRALSLRSASALAGALRLAAIADALVALALAGAWLPASYLAVMQEGAKATHEVLSAHFGELAGWPQPSPSR